MIVSDSVEYNYFFYPTLKLIKDEFKSPENFPSASYYEWWGSYRNTQMFWKVTPVFGCFTGEISFILCAVFSCLKWAGLWWKKVMSQMYVNQSRF